jgi:hypothetical protein
MTVIFAGSGTTVCEADAVPTVIVAAVPEKLCAAAVPEIDDELLDPVIVVFADRATSGGYASVYLIA